MATNQGLPNTQSLRQQITRRITNVAQSKDTMQFANFIAAAVGLIAATVAATPVITHSRFTSTAFEVTNLTMTRQPGGLANLTFIVHDGEPAANTTTTCAGSWAYGSSGWPKDGYQACNNAHIQWNMASYDSWTSFTLNMDHIFFDPA